MALPQATQSQVHEMNDEHPSQYIWPCSWNWCPDTFRSKADLLVHLHGTHFRNIFKVKKRDWETYLRSTEGRSGLTGMSYTSTLTAHFYQRFPLDSLLDANLTYPSTSSTESAARNVASQSSASSEQRSPPPATPPPRYPPLPRNFRSSRSLSNASSHTPPLRNPSPMLPPASPASAQHGPSPAKKRRMSFASYNAQSSPMSTPSVPSVPASPALSNMLTDAINRAGQLNARSPNLSHSASGRFAATGMQVSPRMLPRRTSMGASPSPLSQSSLPIPMVPRPVSPTRREAIPKMSTSPAASTSVDSAQAVEDTLTQNISSQSPSVSRTNSGDVKGSGGQPPSHASIGTSNSSSQKLSQSSDMQVQSYCGSHAVESMTSFPVSSSNPLIHPETQPEFQTLPSQPSASPPLPRTRRARSRASADTQPSQAPAPAPTRILRSRSKTPAPVPPAKIPLPRRTNRTRGSSVSTANSQPRASSKPPSTRRAGSKQAPPRAQAESGMGTGTFGAPGQSACAPCPLRAQSPEMLMSIRMQVFRLLTRSPRRRRCSNSSRRFGPASCSLSLGLSRRRGWRRAGRTSQCL